jgi:hypothetical protein
MKGESHQGTSPNWFVIFAEAGFDSPWAFAPKLESNAAELTAGTRLIFETNFLSRAGAAKVFHFFAGRALDRWIPESRQISDARLLERITAESRIASAFLVLPPNVKDEPRPSPARLVQRHDLDSAASFRSIVQ